MVTRSRGKPRAPHATALLLIDFFNPISFDKPNPLAPWALKAARSTRRLKDLLARKRIPSIYVNDNFDDWSGNFSHLLDRCAGQHGAAREIVELLRPGEKDYVLMKPRHSAFYGTSLEFVLEELDVRNVIITGLEADVCIFFTAQDAYVRQFSLWIPANCVGTKDDRYYRTALEHMHRNLKATTAPVGRTLDLESAFPPGQKDRPRAG
jgi:nicotinamidase-related amidase